MQRSLDHDKISATVRRLHTRIAERFPESGLATVCEELRRVVDESVGRLETIGKPNVPLRLDVGVLVIGVGAVIISFVASHRLAEKDLESKKTFDFTWLSDQATSTTRATGTARQVGTSRVLTFKGMLDDAMAGKRAVRHTFSFRDDGTIEFTPFDTLPNGKELKIMVITLTPDKK